MPAKTEAQLARMIEQDIRNDLRGIVQGGDSSYYMTRLEKSLPKAIAKAIAAAVKEGIG